MRPDSFGLFWQDNPAPREGGRRERPMAPIPESDWRAPAEFPNLSGASTIALDTETYDPELLDYGPGWARGKGHVVGVSLAVDGASWYFPMRHTICPEQNMEPEKVLAYLKETLGRKHQPKVGANLLYDVGWLKAEGVEVRGQLIDVQIAESLLDETSPLALEHLAAKYLGEGKETSLLYRWCADSFGGEPGPSQRKHIWRSPPCLVGPYAEADAELPLKIARKQYPLMVAEKLLSVFDLESRLLPLLIEMRMAGVRVDLNRAERLREELAVRLAEEQAKIRKLVGFDININAGDSIAEGFRIVGVDYPTTAKGKPSFTKEFLEGANHPLASMIVEARKLDKLRSTFVESYILDSHVDGKVYCQFHPTRNEGGGTRSGRLSSSNPNLQNIPSRDEILAPLIRSMFIPDEGHRRWVRYDYSQIEYRFLLHYAVGPGADEIRAYFQANPETDFHERTLDLVAPVAGWDISTKELRKSRRKPVKNINFGLCYGMSERRLTASLGLSDKEGKALFEAYHAATPFVSATMAGTSEEAKRLGYITTVLDRRSRFHLFEPRSIFGAEALPYDKAKAEYGLDLQRAYTHKALNRRLQGSAADLMKMAMVLCYEQGLFDVTGVPRLTVHDELDFSDPGGCDEAFAEILRVLESAIPLRVPLKADFEAGPDWGNLK